MAQAGWDWQEPEERKRGAGHALATGLLARDEQVGGSSPLVGSLVLRCFAGKACELEDQASPEASPQQLVHRRTGSGHRVAADPRRADKRLGGTLAAARAALITSSCGMNHLPREVNSGKLAAMAEARDILRGVLVPA